jgi:hypothetical protein
MSQPREGIHAHRIPILDVATVDTLGTIAGGYLLAKWMDWSSWKTIIALFAISLPVHHYFRIDSKLHHVAMEVLDVKMDVEGESDVSLD